MNLKIQYQGQELNFEGIKSLNELKSRLQQAEPSFVLESLTYKDEENDIITISNENDFNCLSATSYLIIQAYGKFDQECVLKDVKKNQNLLKRLAIKVNQFKEKQKNNLINRRNNYQTRLTKIMQQKQYLTQEIDKEIQSIKQQIEIQKKYNIINNKTQIRCVIQEQMMKFHLCNFVKQEEANLTYNEESLEQFMSKIELLEENIFERFFQSYNSMRLNKLIEMKEKQISGNENLLELSKQQQLVEQFKKKLLFQLNLQENYFTQKLKDAEYLLENL
ncbi:unnamed protein product [Paramecium primaurelia]|uniref:Uncharacterized protein n=1 Tax=Paramecium primaurelia TaxID=5886 RepID=A0A8S1KAR0_PARPR|nr:unnamed protein product [Paramecium primaurelia]